MKRLPVFLMIFVGVLGSLSYSLHHFFMHGGVLELSLLQPYYTPWLKKKGIHKALLFLTKETTGGRHWILGAKHITFHGGSLEKIHLFLGWNWGSVSIRHIHMEGLHLHLNDLFQSQKSNFSPLVFVPILMNGSGVIQQIRLSGTLPEWSGGNLETPKVNPFKKQSIEGPTVPLYGTQNSVLYHWKLYWDKGKIAVWPHTMESSNSGASAMIQDQGTQQPLFSMDVKQDQRGGHIQASCNRLNSPGDMGLSPMILSGQGPAHWTMHDNPVHTWSIQWALNQEGSSCIQDLMLDHKTQTQSKIPGVNLSNFWIQGQHSQALPILIHAKGMLDQAKVSVHYRGMKTSGFSLQAHLDHGPIPLLKLHHLWPRIPSSLGVRSWILDHSQGGYVTHASVSVSPKKGHPGAHSKGIREVDVQGRLNIENWDLSLVSNLPSIEKMNVSSTFTAKGLDIKVTKGRIAQHDLHGKVVIDMNRPTLNLDVTLKGPLARLTPTVLQFSGAPNLGVTRITGTGKTHITGSFPLRSTLSQKDIHLNLHSDIPKAGFDFPLGRFTFNVRNTHLILDHQNQVTHISGNGATNGIPMHWSWKKNTLQFSAHPTSSHIHTLSGWLVKPYMQGAPRISGSYSQGVLRIDGDFSPTVCSFPWLNWNKPEGQKLDVHIHKTPKKWDVSLNGLGVSGKATVDYAQKIPITSQCSLGETFFRYAFTPDHSSRGWEDLWAKLNHSGHHQLFFRTPFLNLSGWKTSGFHPKQNASALSLLLPSSDNPSLKVRIDMDLACEKIQCPTLTMDQVHLELSGKSASLFPLSGDQLPQFSWNKGSLYSVHHANSQGNVKRKRAKSVQKSGHVSILWEPLKDGQNRILADITDLGSVCNGLGITQRIRGGDLGLEAMQNRKGHITGSIHVDGMKTKLGALGKLLSSISPTMFIEMFSSGVLFNQIDGDFEYVPGELKLINAVAKGVNLGLVLKGKIYTDLKQFKLQGVVIPSYLINTFFSQFPVFGWILGGKKGLISSDFKMTGPWNNPKITTVPLSLFKLGFLKNIPLFKKSKRPLTMNPSQKRDTVEKSSAVIQKTKI